MNYFPFDYWGASWGTGRRGEHEVKGMYSAPQTPPEEIRQLNRSLLEKVIDKAASDPEWKQQLLDDPEAAIREAGFPEAERLREAYEGAMAEEEVAGHVYESSEPRTPIYRPDPREGSGE